jgi:hypothetical protein
MVNSSRSPRHSSSSKKVWEPAWVLTASFGVRPDGGSDDEDDWDEDDEESEEEDEEEEEEEPEWYVGAVPVA